MNKLIKLLALTGLFMPGIAFAANTAQPNQTNVVLDQDQRFAIPKDKNAGVPDVFDKWAPDAFSATGFTVTVTTIVASGSGLVDGICVSSGAAGDYAVLYDTTGVYGANGASATVGNFVALAGSAALTANYGRITMAHTASYAESTSNLGANENAGCQNFITPLPFSNGLYIQMSAATSISSVRYRLLRRTGG